MIGPPKGTGPGQVRRSNKIAVSLTGSIGGRTMEIRIGLSRSRGQGEKRNSALPPEPHEAEIASSSPGGRLAGMVAADADVRTLDLNEPEGHAGPAGSMASFWDSLSSDQRHAFMAKAQKRAFPAGARLMREGESGDHVAVVLSGLTEIRVWEGATERVLAERGPGQLIGERAALEVSARSATVIAMATVVALVMRTDDFAAFISTYPAVLKIVEDQIYYRLREGTTRYGPGPGDRYPENAYANGTASWPRSLIGQNCTVVRTDVVGFGADKRDDGDRRIIRQVVPVMTRSALGPVWDVCRREDRGDGQLLIVSPDVPTSQVIARLATVLPAELRRHNRTYSSAVEIRLRVAVEVGPIEEDNDGVSGQSIIWASRMLDAPAFKQAMAIERAVLGVVVSRFVYDSTIAGDGGLDLDSFSEVPVQVKDTRGSAWMRLM